MVSDRKQPPSLDVQRVLPAYQQVAKQLTSLVLSGELTPGQRLPVEAELAARFGVSRSTVREGLRVMSAQNLVVTLRGVTGGTFVVHPNHDQLSGYLEASLGLLRGSQQVTLDELLEIRQMLEIPAARLAAERRSEEDIKAIEGALAGAGDVEAGHSYEGNRSFHAAILAATDNSLLGVVTEPVFGVLQTHILRDSAPVEFWKKVATEHRKIAAAIVAGDADAAELEMSDHLEQLRGTYLSLYRKSET